MNNSLLEEAFLIEVAAGMRECGHTLTEIIYNSGQLAYYTCICRSYVYELIAGHEVQRSQNQPRGWA